MVRFRMIISLFKPFHLSVNISKHKSHAFYVIHDTGKGHRLFIINAAAQCISQIIMTGKYCTRTSADLCQHVIRESAFVGYKASDKYTDE